MSKSRTSSVIGTILLVMGVFLIVLGLIKSSDTIQTAYDSQMSKIGEEHVNEMVNQRVNREVQRQVEEFKRQVPTERVYQLPSGVVVRIKY